MTKLYASDRGLRAAAFLTLDLPELAAPLPQTISQRLPGTLRPFSRELVIANPARQNVPGARALRPSYMVARIRVGGTRVCG